MLFMHLNDKDVHYMVSDHKLNDDDRNAIEEIAVEKMNAELSSIFSKIVEKSEFLIKLFVPAIYQVTDT